MENLKNNLRDTVSMRPPKRLVIRRKKNQKVNYAAGPKIPLWNVKKIGTTVVKEKGIVDMTFTMRYTNFSSVAGRNNQEI